MFGQVVGEGPSKGTDERSGRNAWRCDDQHAITAVLNTTGGPRYVRLRKRIAQHLEQAFPKCHAFWVASCRRTEGHNIGIYDCAVLTRKWIRVKFDPGKLSPAPYAKSFVDPVQMIFERSR